MNDEMLKTIIPKSDQLNADDLLGGRTITIKITKTSILAGDQPVALHYEGDHERPYKPCKTMRRVVVSLWGPDANKYTGQKMTLFRDDEVRFGADQVGGIRISHMSGIAQITTVMVTVSRGRRLPYTVKPLAKAAAAPEGRFDYQAAGNAAAERGTTALEAFWTGLSNPERNIIGAAQLASWKRTASDADRDGASDAPPHPGEEQGALFANHQRRNEEAAD